MSDELPGEVVVLVPERLSVPIVQPDRLPAVEFRVDTAASADIKPVAFNVDYP